MWWVELVKSNCLCNFIRVRVWHIYGIEYIKFELLVLTKYGKEILDFRAVITPSNLSWYYIPQWDDSDRTYIQLMPSRASYKLYVAGIWKKINRVITAPHCIYEFGDME